jgi:hypothetical protein
MQLRIMMKRVIYSIYIDIPSEELDWQPPYQGETESKNDKTKREFMNHYRWLSDMQVSYARHIDVEYKQFLNDDSWRDFEAEYKRKYPFLTMYNIVNFYKIHLMYELAKQYDEILYLDLDVVPVTGENFFDVWNFDNGVAILKNDPKVNTSKESIRNNVRYRKESGKSVHSIRSPAAKYWNCYAMLEEEGYNPTNNVYNTGIVGINKQLLDKLDYFNNFDQILDNMTEMKIDPDSMYPLWIQEMFGWDNETLWGFKMATNDVPMQWLDFKWHYFMDKMKFIPKNTCLVHVINKEFQFVRNWCESHNIQHLQ